MTSTKELLYAAGIPVIPPIRDYEAERFAALQDELSVPAWLDEVEHELALREVISLVEISTDVRKQCEAELAAAKKSGWRIQ